MENIISTENIISDIESIINHAQTTAVRSVNFERVLMYWKIGERIVVEEQNNQERAEYGKYIIENISEALCNQFGQGFSRRNLYRSVHFYLSYPIVATVLPQLNWSQYCLLIHIKDADKRLFYELEATKNKWSVRELKRQINSLFYERLLMSSNKETVLKYAKEDQVVESPTDIIKDPMVLEFLGLEDHPHYRESDLETALINHLEAFMLELGNGFSFVARQKRISLDGDNFYIDLIFYNRLLQAHVIIEIKTHALTHEDLGQLQMYVNYYDREVKLEHEANTIGILLCTEKNEKLVKYSLPKENKSILASKYQLLLPSEKEFLTEINKIQKKIELSR